MNPFNSVQFRKPKKNKFDLSHERKMSMKMNNLTPIMLQEVVPGDKFRVNSEIMLRLAPMLAPIMHRVNVTTHYFFVPNRLVWNEWEDFITGGEDGKADPPFPAVYINAAGTEAPLFRKGTLADYFGLPVFDDANTGTNGQNISILPFRAYQTIYNEYYRDQNIEEKIDVPKGSSVTSEEVQNMLKLRKRAWEKDYYTSALPWSQRGGEVKLPLSITEDSINYLEVATQVEGQSVASPDALEFDAAGQLRTVTQSENVGIKNIESIDVDASTINDLRKATRLQEWLEKSARGGSRYIEQIFSHFGVKSSDARLQRPEFLGGGKQPVVISEVLSTYSATDMGVPSANPQGDMTGHGISVGRSNGFNKSFEEHGFVIGIMSILPKTAYQQGINRMWQKFSKFDYYWPEFANLGEQEIKSKELFFDPSETGLQNDETFGYQQRYAEYKYQQSSVHGDFRDNLAYWHMGRIFDNRPQLNEEFIISDATKRIFAVEDEETDEIYAQVYNKVDALRPMPYFSIPTL